MGGTTVMTEYYTTSELGHAWFAIFQGFERCETYVDRFDWNINLMQNGETETTGYSKNLYVAYFIAESFNAKKWRFPKTPHNMALMKEQDGDIVFYEDEGVGSIYGNYFEDDFLYVQWAAHSRLDSLFLYVGRKIKIISRMINGKPQPFPVWDKERV
jgi:hypothetical protein